MIYAPAPKADPARGITWLGPRRGASKRGTRRDDTLLGSTGPDVIRGLGGSDDVHWGNQLHNDASRALDPLVRRRRRRHDLRQPRPQHDPRRGRRRLPPGRLGSQRDLRRHVRTRGRGPNSVDAGPGNDTVHAYSRGATAIDCGPGFDTAYVDRDDRVTACERVERR